VADPQVTVVVDKPMAAAPTLRPVVAWTAIVVLVVLAVIRSAVATRTDGFTIDDAYHITAGVSYVKLRDFRLNPEHPPLVKLWVGAALAPDFQLPPLRPLADKAAERDFNESVVFLDNDPDRVQARARVAMFALNSLLLLLLAWAVSRTLDNVAALGAIAFLTIDPTVAAHLPVVLTDLPVALLATTAILFAIPALRSARWLDVSLAALALGLTLSAKHSGLIALVAVGGCGAAVALLPKIASLTISRARVLVVTLTILLGALVVLWGLYGFRYSETASGEEAFNRPLALKMEDVRGSVARKTLHVLAGAHLLPRSYIWGLADTIRTGLEGRGRQSKSAYYFLSVIATKLPLGLLALALSGLILLTMRRSPRSWRLPGLALIFLAALFLAALARGASSGGMRHALPVLVVLGVFGGMFSVFAISKRSRLARLMVAFAVAIAAASAVPRIRPWEYFNEIIGGPERAYLYFGDESVDIGQRRLDFVRFYREHLEPAGEVPYLLYPMAPSEQQRRGVRTMGEWRTDSQEDIQWPDVSGIFFLSAVHINRNPRYRAFSGVPPVGRIGNLLIYRGTFHIPWLRERQLLVRASRLRTSPEPDLERAEALLREVLTINPNSFGALLTLGNLKLRRNQREEALRFYERAREQLGNEDQAMRPVLTQQIERLSSNEPLERIPPVRGTREE
jgi:Dolichyl-phosphate-mannose-protein mannosyltransferase/Tetratricopeptide repeat